MNKHIALIIIVICALILFLLILYVHTERGGVSNLFSAVGDDEAYVFRVKKIENLGDGEYHGFFEFINHSHPIAPECQT